MTSSTQLLAVLTGLATLLHLGLSITLFLVVVTVVRRHRPDAWGLLAAAFGLQTANSVFHFVAPMALRLFTHGGVDALLAFQAILTGVGAVESVAYCGLLAAGLVRLAQPPRGGAVAAPPYG